MKVAGKCKKVALKRVHTEAAGHTQRHGQERTVLEARHHRALTLRRVALLRNTAPIVAVHPSDAAIERQPLSKVNVFALPAGS